MGVLQELTNDQINTLLIDATSRKVPASITIQIGNRWLSLKSKVLEVQEDRLLLQLPLPEEATAPHEFVPAEKIGVAFKLKHHKHVFCVTVVGVTQGKLEDGTDVPVLSVCLPSQAQRIQRRVFNRVDVPSSTVVRAAMWLGGRHSEPAGTTPDRPVWAGQVMNLSLGGFQMRTAGHAAGALDTGDIVGVRLVFGAGKGSVYLDAQFRHAEPDGNMTLLGSQFIGLYHTAEGKEVLTKIAVHVKQFQNA